MPTGITAGTGPVVITPPSWSLAGDWIAPAVSTAVIFTIQAGVGSVIDVHLDFVTGNNVGLQTISLATAALGAMYYSYLDGSSTHLYQPVGRPSTF